MKKRITLILAFAMIALLTACTDGGNVSDRTDGMIAESTTVAAQQTELPTAAAEPEVPSGLPFEPSGMTGASDPADSSEPSSETAEGARTGSRSNPRPLRS